MLGDTKPTLLIILYFGTLSDINKTKSHLSKSTESKDIKSKDIIKNFTEIFVPSFVFYIEIYLFFILRYYSFKYNTY